jgi:hypothetical protein
MVNPIEAGAGIEALGSLSLMLIPCSLLLQENRIIESPIKMILDN